MTTIEYNPVNPDRELPRKGSTRSVWATPHRATRTYFSRMAGLWGPFKWAGSPTSACALTRRSRTLAPLQHALQLAALKRKWHDSSCDTRPRLDVAKPGVTRV